MRPVSDPNDFIELNTQAYLILYERMKQGFFKAPPACYYSCKNLRKYYGSDIHLAEIGGHCMLQELVTIPRMVSGMYYSCFTIMRIMLYH